MFLKKLDVDCFDQQWIRKEGGEILVLGKMCPFSIKCYLYIPVSYLASTVKHEKQQQETMLISGLIEGLNVFHLNIVNPRTVL